MVRTRPSAGVVLRSGIVFCVVGSVVGPGLILLFALLASGLRGVGEVFGMSVFLLLGVAMVGWPPAFVTGVIAAILAHYLPLSRDVLLGTIAAGWITTAIHMKILFGDSFDEPGWVAAVGALAAFSGAMLYRRRDRHGGVRR